MSPTVAFAPGRVNLIGEHLDYNGGCALPVALRLGTTATVRDRHDGMVEVRSGDLVWRGEPGASASGWAAYVIGVLAELGVRAALDIAIHSDLPIGAGLSSSAALECAVALAVNEHRQLGRSTADLVEACIRAETVHVGAPTGGLDQNAVLRARPGHALLLDFATGAHRYVPFEPAADGLALMVVDTGVTHAHVHADGGYRARRDDCEAAARELGVDHLARATKDDVDGLAGRIGARARHVVSEQARVVAFVAAVERRDWPTAGRLLTASHVSLRDDFEVSCPELDHVVDASLAAGALGARMTGGGFGGAAIVLVEASTADDVRGAITAGFASRGWTPPTYLPT